MSKSNCIRSQNIAFGADESNNDNRLNIIRIYQKNIPESVIEIIKTFLVPQITFFKIIRPRSAWYVKFSIEDIVQIWGDAFSEKVDKINDQ